MIDIYTPIEAVKEQGQKRWGDEALKKEVAQFVRQVPAPMLAQPRAWLGRYIASPDHELFQFLRRSQEAGLKPLIIEALDDNFYRHNVDKMCLAQMGFLDKDGGEPLKTKIIDVKRSHMKPFSSLKTSWGQDFIEFHHQLFFKHIHNVERYAASPWFNLQGHNAKEYYPPLLALFICYGVMFEDFITNEDEERFAVEVVYPAFEAIQSRFGMRPLIARIYSDEELSQPYTFCYPQYMLCELPGEAKGELSRHS